MQAAGAVAMGSQCPCSGWPGTCKIPGIGPYRKVDLAVSLRPLEGTNLNMFQIAIPKVRPHCQQDNLRQYNCASRHKTPGRCSEKSLRPHTGLGLSLALLSMAERHWGPGNCSLRSTTCHLLSRLYLGKCSGQTQSMAERHWGPGNRNFRSTTCHLLFL